MSLDAVVAPGQSEHHLEDSMSAQIIQFVPRPRPTKPIPTPIDFAIWNIEATTDWLRTLNDYANPNRPEPPKDSA